MTTALTVDDRELIERLRKDADRQDGEEESIVSTNCMRNSADRLQSLLSDRDKLEALAAKLVAKLDECAPHVANLSAIQFVRSGVQYTGPSYGEALAELRAALTQTEVP